MSKIVLDDTVSGYNLQIINNNFDKLEQELQNKVLYRDNPEGEPNAMQQDLDMNGNDILNVGTLHVTNSFSVDGVDIAAQVALAQQAVLDAEAAADNEIAEMEVIKAATQAIYDGYDARELGAKAIDPTTDNQGNPLLIGAQYWNTNSLSRRVWNGTTWENVTPAGNMSKKTYVADVVEDFVSDPGKFIPGTTTTLVLPTDPLIKANVDVVFDAAWQQQTEFSLSSTNLTFTSPIPVGVAQVEVSYTTPLNLAIPTADAEDVTYTPRGTGAQQTTVQTKLREMVSVKDFGAVGDGITDDTAAIQAAINAANRIDFGDVTNTYKITSALNLSAGNKWLSGSGATIDMRSIPSGNLWGIKAQGSIGTGVAITSGATQGSFTINLANTTGFAVGDFVQIASSDNYPYGAGSYNVNKGEIKKIRSVVANTSITFTTPLLDTYTTTPKVYPLSMVNNIHICGLTIQGSNIAARNERGIVLEYVNRFSVVDCKLDGQDQYQIEAASCLYGTIERNLLRSAFYDGVTGTIFYGIVVMDCSQWINVGHNIGDRARHLVVTTARTSGQGFYGQPYFVNIHHNHFYDSMSGGAGRSFAYEQHGFGRFVTFDGNSAHGCYSGIRVEGGVDIRVVNNSFKDYGYAGIIIGGSSTLTKNVLVAGNLVDGYTGEVTTGEPAAVRFEAAGATISNVKVSGNILTNTYNATAAAGVGISVGSNTYASTAFEHNQIDAGRDASAVAISIGSGANGISLIGNRTYRYRGGITLNANSCVAKSNLIEHSSTQTTGFGLYSNGDRNVFSSNTCRFINTAFRADTSSTNNLFVENQAMQCTVGTFSNVGVGNVGRNNDVI